MKKYHEIYREKRHKDSPRFLLSFLPLSQTQGRPFRKSFGEGFPVESQWREDALPGQLCVGESGAGRHMYYNAHTHNSSTTTTAATTTTLPVPLPDQPASWGGERGEPALPLTPPLHAFAAVAVATARRLYCSTSLLQHIVALDLARRCTLLHAFAMAIRYYCYLLFVAAPQLRHPCVRVISNCWKCVLEH